MSAQVLDCKVVAQAISEECKAAADELKAVLGVEKFDAVILATGKNFADALGGGYLAARKSAPILLTKESQKDKVIEALKLGARDFIQKPFDPDDIAAVINKLFPTT